MAKINGNEAPEAITKIQLLTKTSTEETIPLENIQLDQGEPLFDPNNTEGKHLHIGTSKSDEPMISFYDSVQVDEQISSEASARALQDNALVTSIEAEVANRIDAIANLAGDGRTIETVKGNADAIAKEIKDRADGDTALSGTLTSLKTIQHNDSGDSNLFVSDVSINNAGNLTLTRSEIELIDAKVNTMLNGKYPTITVGGITKDVAIDASNIYSLLCALLGIGNAPDVTGPSHSMTVEDTSVGEHNNINSLGKSEILTSLESGTIINPKVTISFEDGGYQYGPEPTGVTVQKDGYQYKTSIDIIDGATDSTAWQLSDEQTYSSYSNYGPHVSDLSTELTLTTKVAYENNSDTIANGADQQPDTTNNVKISSGETEEQSKTITWYRHIFMCNLEEEYTGNSKDFLNTYTPSNIRQLCESSETGLHESPNHANGNIPQNTYTAPVGSWGVIIAAPASLNASVVYYTNGAWTDVPNLIHVQGYIPDATEGSNAETCLYDIYAYDRDNQSSISIEYGLLIRGE